MNCYWPDQRRKRRWVGVTDLAHRIYTDKGFGTVALQDTDTHTHVCDLRLRER